MSASFSQNMPKNVICHDDLRLLLRKKTGKSGKGRNAVYEPIVLLLLPCRRESMNSL
jgi:hypothetical protein